MNFKFKLSKRLALIKAALVASTALALACDRTDLTSPQPPPRPLAADVTSLPVLSVTASGYQDPNLPQNTLDDNLATRWSAYGDGQWIRYDLGALTAINAVTIAWYMGTSWSEHFDIQVSLDTLTWTTVFSGQSSGLTLQLETYAFPPVAARYLRIVGHGQWSGPTLLTLWNSIPEVAVQGTALPTLSVAAVVASGNDGNIPQNTLDNNPATRWSAYGDGQWIRYDLGALTAINAVSIAWYMGDTRSTHFDIQVSLDTVTWTTVFSGQSSGQTLQLETYAFPPVAARYVRIVGHGQWSGPTPLAPWNSITEVGVQGTALPTLSVAAVVASGNDGNVPQNTLDNNLTTRWSASGDGQWILYDLGALTAIDGMNIAWYLGDSRSAHFDIQVSLDTVTWTTVFSGQSSGQTLQLETYAFPPASGRYVRIVGHGQWSGPTLLTLWNSITAAFVSGTPAPAPTDAVLPVVSVTASANDFNVPQNTLDHDFSTRWSAYGDPQWIRYDAGVVVGIDRVDIAWYLGNPVVNGPTRFDIQVSLDTVTWTTVFSGQNRGQTTQFETYSFPTASGRYVRIVAHGNSMNAWNSITDVVLYDPPGTATAPGTNVPLASVTVTPASASIMVGATVQLSAVTKDSAGNTLAGQTVTWASGDTAVATVSASGLVSGAAAGLVTITATSGGKSATATVTVSNAPVASVASVVISPATATLLLGVGLQLSATLKDSAGKVLSGRTVTWTSGTPAVASVSASGLVLGLGAGSATMTATSEGVSGTAAISVASASSSPRPGPTDTIIFQDGFESGSLSAWTQDPGNNGRYSTTTSAARVKSGTRSLEALYTPTNGYGLLARWFMPGYDEVYVKFDVMFEEGFQNMRGDGAGMHYFVVSGNRIDDSKSSFGIAGRVPNGTDFFYAGIDPEEVSLPTLQPFSYYTYYPDMSCCYGNRWKQQLPKIALVGGQWQEVVFRIKLNTPGQYDGSQTMWINGVKQIDVQNMRWRTTTDLRINEVSFQNYMPGGLKTQHVWVDDVIVWRP